MRASQPTGPRPPIVPTLTRPPVVARPPIILRATRPPIAATQTVGARQPVGTRQTAPAVQAPISTIRVATPQGARHINRYVNEEGFIVDSQGRYVVNNQGKK